MKRLYRITRKAGERCELCSAPLEEPHPHLFEARTRQMRCACRGCSLIVPTGGTHRVVPRRFDALAIDAKAWLLTLGVPVGVAAIVRRDDGRTVVCYPGAAGLVESELATDELVNVPALEPEVEAVVLSSLPDGGAWHTGIDVVFEIVGAVRTAWRGMTGGPDVPTAIRKVIEGARA